MILILTEPGDPHADRVGRLLSERGAAYVRFDSADFPTRSSVTIEFEADRLRARSLVYVGGNVDLNDVTAVWFRRPGRPLPTPDLEGSPIGDFIAEESATAMSDLWETLDVRCVPGPRPVVLRAQYKLRQLQLAGRLGFELPRTVVTTDPSVFLDFYSAENGRIITKRIGFSELPPTADGDVVARYTEPVHHHDVIHARDVSHCPVIAQAYVPKDRELRVTVVGDTIFAAAIHSQEANHTRHDWRRYDDAQTVITPYELPAPVANACFALVQALGLCYGAIDLVLTPDGRHVFLEINSSGQYLWVEEACGLPISGAVADLLSGVAPSAGARTAPLLRRAS